MIDGKSKWNMANNRMYIRCDCCGSKNIIAKHMATPWYLVDYDNSGKSYLDKFFDEHAWCDENDEYGNMSHFSIVYEDSNKVNRLDSVDRRGKWVKVYGEHISMGHRPWTLACSECGRLGNGTPYCPNCGAKMEVEEDE